MSEARGIVLQVDDGRIRQQAAAPAASEGQAGYDLPWERTLFLDSQVGRVSWAYCRGALISLARWRAAAPVWSYETLASDAAAGASGDGPGADRDLRVPLYEVGLLFVRRCEAGEQLLEAWDQERAGGHGQLAFLRALYEVKPLFLALPRSWLAASARATTAPRRVVGDQTLPNGLVRVKVGPARYVRCRPGEEDMIRQRYAERKARR